MDEEAETQTHSITNTKALGSEPKQFDSNIYVLNHCIRWSSSSVDTFHCIALSYSFWVLATCKPFISDISKKTVSTFKMAIPQNSKHCPAKIPNFHVTQITQLSFPKLSAPPNQFTLLLHSNGTSLHRKRGGLFQTEDATDQYSARVWTNLILVIGLLPVLHPNDFPWATFSFRFDEKIRSQAKKSKFSDRFAKRRKRKKNKNKTKPPVAGPQTLRQQSKRSSTTSAGVLRFLMCLTVNGPLTHLFVVFAFGVYKL